MFKIKNKNAVVSLIDYLNEFKSDIKKTNTNNRIKKIAFENELMEAEIANFLKEMEHDKNRAKRDYFQSIKNISHGFKLLHFLACVCSLILTPMGFGLIESLLTGYRELFPNGFGEVNISKDDTEIFVKFCLDIIIISIITIIQIKGFYYASIYNQIDQYFHKSAWLAKLITLIIIPVSITGNFNELLKVIKFTNLLIINAVVVILICLALDSSIILGFRLKHDKKYKNYQCKEDVEGQESDKLTIWNMVKTFTIDLIKCKVMKPFYEKRKEIGDKYRKYNPKEDPEVKSLDGNNPFVEISRDGNVLRFPGAREPINVEAEVDESNPDEQTETGTTTENKLNKNNEANNEDKEFTVKERDNYLKFIIKNRDGSSILTNAKVIKATKNSKDTINLSNPKIQAIRDELYRCKILIQPVKPNAKTHFTQTFLKIINDNNFDENNIPKLVCQLSDRYKNLDRENENNLNKA